MPGSAAVVLMVHCMNIMRADALLRAEKARQSCKSSDRVICDTVPAAVDLVAGPLVGSVSLGLQRGAFVGQLPRAAVSAGAVRRGRPLQARLAALVQVIRPRPALLRVGGSRVSMSRLCHMACKLALLVMTDGCVWAVPMPTAHQHIL